MTHYALIMDIETGPLPTEDIIHLAPEFSAPKNYKDEAKIQAYVEKEFEKWASKAALSAMTGEVVAVGFLSSKTGAIKRLTQGEDGEKELLTETWATVESAMREGGLSLCGHNIVGFDLPFLVRRSIYHGVMYPAWARQRYPKGVIDTMLEWKMGTSEKWTGLDALARFLGVGQKNGNGADFAATLKTDEAAALAYLDNDLIMTLRVAERMGVIECVEVGA